MPPQAKTPDKRDDRKSIAARISRFFQELYLKLFRIDDTPQKIALGFGLGVTLGIMPVTGAVAALFLAVIFKVNRASALLGSVLTNTWLSIPVFFLSVKTGSLVTGSRINDIYAGWSSFLHDFSWAGLFRLSLYKVLVPIAVGYLLVSLSIGILAYAIVLPAIKIWRKEKRIQAFRPPENH
jgi:uncharacterized protein